MAVVKMKKVTVAGLEKDKSYIVDELMKIGTVDINDIDDPQGELDGIVQHRDLDDVIAGYLTSAEKIKEALSGLKRLDKNKKGLFSFKRSVNETEIKSISENKEYLLNIVDEINGADGKIKAVNKIINDKSGFINKLRPWVDLDIQLEEKSSRRTDFFIGTLPKGRTNQLDLFLQNDITKQVYYQVINENDYVHFAFFACHKSDSEELISVLRQLDFEHSDFQNLKGTVKINISRIEKEIKEHEKEITEIDNSIGKYTSEAGKLEMLYDYMIIEKEKHETLSKIIHTEKTFIIDGWIPYKEIEGFKKRTTAFSDMCYISIDEPEEGESYPVLLENNRFVKPFELITELYSLPKSGELDPNVFMAPFFFMFFGLMLSDAGYGILISIACFFVIKKLKPEGMADKLLKLLFLGGISTFLWGALFGGWFGDMLTQLSSGKIEIKPLWFNPLNDPMKLLIWSFGFGVLQLFTAMGVKAYDKAKKGFVLDAVLDTIFWYIFILGLIFLLMGEAFDPISKYMTIIGAAGLILTQGRKEKGIIKKLFKGVASLYNVVGFMSDVLSYSRLLALGLATGVVASVINTIGLIFGFNVIGIIIFIFVFMVGHIFNILINALGAFVHASRLQYVEFFGKFYEGGGKAYKPFKFNTKYININGN